MHPTALPSSSFSADPPEVPRKRIPASLPISPTASSSLPTVRKLQRRNLPPEVAPVGKGISEEGIHLGRPSPTRIYTAASIDYDSWGGLNSGSNRIFSLSNLIVGLMSLVVGGSLIALLLTLINLSGILERLAARTDFASENAEPFAVKTSSDATPPASELVTNTSPLPALPPVPTTRAMEPASIPAPTEKFIAQPVADSLSAAPDLSVPDLFGPIPAKEKPKQASRETAKKTSSQPSKNTSKQATKDKPKQTSNQGVNQGSNKTASPASANTQYGVSELDGTPRLLRHGSATFPPSLARKGISRGTVVFEVELSASGSVSIKRVVSTTHADLVEPARRVASSARFTPPKRGGQAVNAVMRWPIIIEK